MELFLDKHKLYHTSSLSRHERVSYIGLYYIKNKGASPQIVALRLLVLKDSCLMLSKGYGLTMHTLYSQILRSFAETCSSRLNFIHDMIKNMPCLIPPPILPQNLVFFHFPFVVPSVFDSKKVNN